MFLNIYSVIWHFLQFLFDIVDNCYRLGIYARAKCKHIQRRMIGENLTSEKLLIETYKTQLSKIPVHLAILLGTELPDFRALSKIIYWSLSTGIPNISFYDHQGKKNLIIFVIRFKSNLFIIIIYIFSLCFHVPSSLYKRYSGVK